MDKETQNNQQDDKVLAQLYKTGSNETPPAKLNYKILDYAANAKNDTENSIGGSSHFSGGWKVPLSMAACLVVVFGLLVQIDQSNPTLELPPIPELSKPSESAPPESVNKKLDQSASPTETASDLLKSEQSTSSFSDDDKKATAEESLNESLMSDTPEDNAVIHNQKERFIHREKLSEKKKAQPQADPPKQSLQLEESVSKSKVQAIPTPANESIQKDAEQEAEATAIEGIQQRSMSAEPMQNHQQRNDSVGASSDTQVDNENEFAPIPVEDWLLMIEKLIARKDYAEAARQLQKFKQAHPNVNVDDLDAKIP